MKKEKSSKQHKHRSDHDRVEKIRERERRSPSNDDKSRSPTPTKSNTNDPSNSTREGTERMSLSIDETNKVRASLGLKPLTIDDNTTADSDTTKKSLNSDENFVHRPAINLTEKTRTEKITEKLSVHKEKRMLQEKFLTTPTLASEPAESTSSWIEKMRQMEEEKRKAAERAKLLEQMDEEFGVNNLIHEESEKQKQTRYTAKNLAGLRVEHSIEEFKEGQQVILTLKDKKIISNKKDDEDEDEDDDEDVLINVNIADNETAKERAELAKKKTPGYRAYNDEETADQFGMLNPNKLLEQYDDKKKSSFRLESDGAYDMSDEKVIYEMKQEIRARMQSLLVPTPKVASEFYTPGEMDQFKKPKKVTKKKIRSRKMLKADDLLAMDSSESRQSSTTTTSVSLRPAETRRSNAIVSTSKERPTRVSLDKVKREIITTTATEDEDMVGSDDLSNFVIEDDAFDELQTVINKTMKLKTKKDSISAEKALTELIEERDRKLKVEIKAEPMEVGIIVPPTTTPPDDKTLVLDTMSEFCRNVGENTIDTTSSVPKLRTSAKIKRANVQTSKKSSSKTNVALDPDDELLQHALQNEDLDDDVMDDTTAEDVNTKPFRLEESILAAEPTLDRGLGSALQLALQKGYIEQEKTRQNARFVSDISAKHYTIEEKSSYEIEDKHARRDRYMSGPLTDFKEKEHYRPDVKLEYVDEGGRRMNEKEAFRCLSHRFHGKGSGKKKTEKRAKKLVEEEMMKKMSSVDTPLQTCNLLKQKQIQLQQPYIVLSTSRSKDSQLPPGNVMSQPIIVPPVHDTSPPPFDDDVDENDLIPTIQNPELLSSASSDVLNNSNDDWKSIDNNNDTEFAQIEDDKSIVNNENVLPNNNITNEENFEEEKNDDDWANFATFENKTDEVSEVNYTFPTATSTNIEENIENDWADFESNTVPVSESPVQSINDESSTKVTEEDDDFGEFSEVQVAPKLETPTLSTNTLSTEQIESLISACFPVESLTSSTNDDTLISTELPSFTTYKNPTKQILCLESSLSLWDTLSNISNDPIGIKFQWRKSNTERLFHQALGVNERFRAKTVPLTPEILQPEKVKQTTSTNSESENTDNENKLSTEAIRPHFDWKQSGLENPLAVFDANKTLDLDFYVPTVKSLSEDEQTTSPASIQRTDSPIIQRQQQSHSIPIKTMDLFPGSTTILNEDAKRIIDSLPNLSFMSAKALMFPIRFNANNNDESTTSY
ncbi:unnamed protein product [Rotaria sp. Silwood2]|nr:unnamed protein product [Rotaria sp. Silwood2]CAF2463058.1 unnamed protein product [Rotaria sp. Silwood2]CAF2853017.1 unnamed protein product [Rotaria sp. Silwood2]CAF3916556.1 unnamed protein product [Rotaria sp. Silwood2]CAF3949069.1 unnamed protein product [Rotaria sp. Silwood2]